MKKNDFYIKVVKLLKERNMTQSELAKKAGIPQPSLSRILSGKHTTQIETIEKIAAALNTSVGDLWDDKNFLQNVNIGTRNTIKINNSFQKQLDDRTAENNILKKQIEVLKDTIKLLELKLSKK